MVYVAMSMILEAKSVIEKFNLKKNLNYQKYDVFENENLTLIIIKTKCLYPTLIISDFFSQIKVNKEDIILNLGISGSKTFPKGEIIHINKIESFILDKSIYPSMVYNLDLKEGSLYSAQNIVKEDIGYDLYDLEGYGFFFTATHYFKSHQIIVVKIVFDSLNNINEFSKTDIMEYIKPANYIIGKLIKIGEDRFNKAKDQELINEKIENFFSKYHFSKQMKIELIKHFEYCSLKDEKKLMSLLDKWINTSIEIRNKNKLKEFFHDIKQSLF